MNPAALKTAKNFDAQSVVTYYVRRLLERSFVPRKSLSTINEQICSRNLYLSDINV